MSKKFSIIVADPPYSFSDSLKQSSVKRGASDNYSTMSINDIINMDVKSITDPSGAILALWVPSSLISEGIQIMNAWGFKLKQSWVWVKIKKDPFKKIRKSKDFDKINWDDFLSFGMGRLGRNVHEIALIGTKGKIYNHLKNKSQRTVFFYENTKHSKKPELLQDKLDIMFDSNLNRLEIFGRRLRDNWHVIGNESPSSLGIDIYSSIEELKKIK